LVAATIIFSFLFSGFAGAQPTNEGVSAKADARAARLAGLAKVWGAVKFFHPFPAYREIDWDKALIETIPRVNAAKTPQEYQAAINSMLAVLDDRNTRAEIAPPAKTSEPSKAEAREFLRLENGVFFIEPVLAAQIHEQNEETYAQILQKNMPLLAQAKSIVIDGRGGAAGEKSEAFDYYFDMFLRQIFPQILDANVPLGVYRYRMHNGYTPQTGASSGGYYSAMVTGAPETLVGQNKNKMLPAVLLINGQTNVSTAMLSGLQAAHKIVVVEEGEALLETNVRTFEIKLPDRISVKMRTAELVNPDGSIGFQPDEIISKKTGEDAALKEALRIAGGGQPTRTRQPSLSANASQIAPKDKIYAEMEFPTAEYRLLALFRFWNVINYFYPYKHLIDKPWDEVLPLYIPKFEANRDAADYQLTVREMLSEVQDSHVGVRNARASSERLGAFSAPAALRFIEKQTVVTGVLDDYKDLKTGDVIVAVNGEPIEKVRERYARYLAASTPQALMRNLHFNLLRGQENSKLKLTVRGIDGALREVETPLISGTDARLAKINRREKTLPVFTVLPSGFGYVDLDRLELGDVNKMFETIKNTPAVIFDMRGYPKGTAWEIAPRLTAKKTPIAALFSRPIREAISLSDSDLADGASFTFAQKLPAPNGEIYKGKVVMLIDEYAQSQSEHTGLFFEAATDVTFIGMPTAGANGDVSFMVLPGNLIVGFSGHDVRHADGRQLQRIGIQPTIRVEPTIRGLLIEKRDEILEAAIKFLQTGVKP
jgi:C-terminal processing protease CtpA/Prc